MSDSAISSAAQVLQPPAAPLQRHAPVTIERPTDTDVSILPPLILAAGLAAGIVVLLRATSPSPLSTLMLERGWTQYLALYLAATTALFVLLKTVRLSLAWRALRAGRKRAASPGWAPEDPGQGAAIRDVLLEHGDAVSLRQARSLQAYLVTGSRSAAATTGEEDAALASQAVEGAYALPRAMVWAIPMLGFIGTVVGISAAVAGFSGFLQRAEEIEEIKQAIDGVTTGLAVAFDTTLVALVLSVLVMLPLVLIERLEVRFLNAIDALVGDSIVARLPERSTDGERFDPAVISDTVKEAIAQHLPPPEAFVSAAEAYLREAAGAISQAARDSASQLAAVTVDIRNFQDRAIAELHARSADAAQPLAQAAQALGRQVAMLEVQATRVDQVVQLEASLVRTLGSLEETGRLTATLDAVRQALASLQPTLTHLNEPRELVLTERRLATLTGDGHASR